MIHEHVIEEFFKDDSSACSYIRDRLLGNFGKAPPPTSDRFVQEFPGDFLQYLLEQFDDKARTIFWNACFELFEDWHDPDKATREHAEGLTQLGSMIRQINHSSPDILEKEKSRWKQALNPQGMRVALYDLEEKNRVYVQGLSLVHIWNLWPDAKWTELYENILESDSPDSETQYEIMLIVIQHLPQDDTSMVRLFRWTMSRGNLPKNFYNEYFLHRLCMCGNRRTDTDMEQQKACQGKLIDDILKARISYFRNGDKDKTKLLGKYLSDASELFDLKSFNCLDASRLELFRAELKSGKG